MNVLLRRTVGLAVNLLSLFPRPEPIPRSMQERRLLAFELKGLRIYDYRSCPRSLKLRRVLHRLNLDIAYCDIQKCQIHQDNLLAALGRLQAPCLRIEGPGGVHWLDEPEEIIGYLCQLYDPDFAGSAASVA